MSDGRNYTDEDYRQLFWIVVSILFITIGWGLFT